VSTVNELLELAEDVIERERLQAEAKQRADEVKENAEITARLNLIVEATGVDAETLVGELGLRYQSGNGYNFVLNYLGETSGINVEKPRGWGQSNEGMVVTFEQALKAESGRASLAKFVLRAKQKYEESKDKVLRNLRGDSLLLFSNWTSERCWSDAEVQAAAVEHLLNHAPTGDESDWSIDCWLENAKGYSDYMMVDAIRAMVTQKRQEKRKREDLLSCINRREDPRTRLDLERVEVNDDWSPNCYPLTRESLDVLWEAAGEVGLAEDPAVILAMTGLESELGDWLNEREREKQRAEIERSSFTPFRYYEVRYSLIGESESGEEREVECDSFAVLHDTPGADGFYHTTNGSVIKPRNVVAVFLREIPTVEAYRGLSWSRRFKCMTDFGDVRVVPDGAELIAAGVK
jgi:hypothetical protein